MTHDAEKELAPHPHRMQPWGEVGGSRFTAARKLWQRGKQPPDVSQDFSKTL